MPSHRQFMDGNGQKTEKKITLPNLEGKFGLSLYLGKKEIFIGIQIGDVEIERVIRKRMIKAPKGNVKVLRFD
jgi:hypothetical protein